MTKKVKKVNMNPEVLALIWNMVSFVVGIFISLCICTATSPAPELTQHQLFDAFKMIANECKGDHERMVDMIDELHRWMNWETDAGPLSKELYEILMAVKVTE